MNLIKFDVKIKVIPNGLEKYMAFFLNKKLVFIDSMQFMNSSLDKSAKNLSDKYFKYLIEEFGSKNLELLKQKGTYRYKYHDHYLEKDVLLLAGVYEKFIDTCLKYYGLDPCHYFSAPGLS